jgi:hypothetical protein
LHMIIALNWFHLAQVNLQYFSAVVI